MATILIIDDEAQMLTLYRAILEREGFRVVESTDGNKGIEICRNESIDLVITDIIMPGKEGIETILELRQEFPKMGIVAVSGGGRLGPDNYLLLAEKMGAQRALSKPFKREELLKAVCGLLPKLDTSERT